MANALKSGGHFASSARLGERRTDARRVAAKQIHLQLRDRVGRNHNLGEVAEAGVDAVSRLAALREFLDNCACRSNARACGVGKADRREVARDGDELLQGQ